MTIDRLRRLFPVTRRVVYLNNAGTGAMPITVVRAIVGFLRQSVENGCVPYAEAEKVAESTRGMAASLMMVKPEEIAFVKNTSSGIIIAIGSIPWEREDNLIMMKDAFPANTYPYHLLLPEVEKRFVTAAELAEGPECLFRLVDSKTRAVALDWVHFLSGVRIDIDTIGEFCQQRGIYFIVDAIQGLGAVAHNFSLSGADFVVAGGGKWLLTPPGIGLLYVNPRKFSRLKPFNLGWLSAHWQDFNDCLTPKPLKKNASRFEEGTKNYLGIYGMQAALKLLRDFGLSDVGERIFNLTRLLRERLVSIGFEIMTPKEKNRHAGIIACRKQSMDMVKLYHRLQQQGFVVAVRENWLRVSPHFYNTEVEIERFVEQLKLAQE
ncbi:MAG: aminotransferase class V-fold PLP-dependent enzyme [bacterium]